MKNSVIILILSIILFYTATASADLNTGLVAYYPFNGNANDESGNGNNGAVYGATLITDRFGNANSAYNFDGADYISISDTPELSGGTPLVKSVSVWFKANAFLPTNTPIVTKALDPSSKDWALIIKDSKLTFYSEKGGPYADYYCSQTTGEILPNVWYHGVFVAEEPNIYIYVDGNMVGSCSNAIGKSTDTTAPIQIGAFTYSSAYYSGITDDIRIYNRALSEAEIQELYNEQIFQTQMPVSYLPNNFGWKFMSYADYKNKNGQTYYVYHPAADLNAYQDELGDKPVYAIAEGEIVANTKGWGGIVIKHDINGQKYYSEYGHIIHLPDESQLQVGMQVKKGDQIGYIGNVGKVPYHLHFEIRSPYHPKPGKANYWDDPNSVKPDRLSRKKVFIAYESPLAFIDTYTDPTSTVILVDDAVTYANIANDIIDNAVQIDINGDGIKEIVKKRFFVGNNLKKWNKAYNGENRGYEGNYHYVITNITDITATGKWYFDIPVSGDYEVFICIPYGSTSKNAKYKIYHNNQFDYVTIDQSLVSKEVMIINRWISLGTFLFQQGSNHFVQLSNNTGEANLQLRYDSIRLVKAKYAIYTVRMHNVDDLAILRINGEPLYKAKWGYHGTEPNWYYFGHKPGDSGEFEITSDLVPGDNSLRFTLWNEAVCCSASLSIEVKKDGVTIFTDSFFKSDSSSGIKYDNTITVTKE